MYVILDIQQLSPFKKVHLVTCYMYENGESLVRFPVLCF